MVRCRVARGPQTVHPVSGVHRVDLIPVSVSGEGVQDGGGAELKVDKAGTPWRDMMCGWRRFSWDRRKTRQPYPEPWLSLKP